MKSPEIVAALLDSVVLFGLELLTWPWRPAHKPCRSWINQHLAVGIVHEKGVKSQTKMIQLVQISRGKKPLCFRLNCNLSPVLRRYHSHSHRT